jgi:hypothetical protein
MSRLTLNQVRAEALFASSVQPSDQPVAQIETAIMQTVRRLGRRGCAAQMAQEFGDTPDTALIRVRWARDTVGEAFSTGQPAHPRQRPSSISLAYPWDNTPPAPSRRRWPRLLPLQGGR